LPTYSFSEPTHADWLSEINIVGGDYPTNLYIMCDVAASTVQFRYSFDNVVWSVFLAYTTMDGNLTHFYEINYGSIEFKISYTGGGMMMSMCILHLQTPYSRTGLDFILILT